MLLTKIHDKQREEGFTLIELLVVVIIIGILAAIAIPVFLNQRQSAWEAAVESDLRNVSVGLETLATDAGGSYPTAADTTVVDNTSFSGLNYSPSAGVTITYTSGDATEYCLTGTHANDATISVVYDSDDGGLADTDGCTL